MSDPIIGSDNEFDHDDLDTTPDPQKLDRKKVRRLVTFLRPADIYMLKSKNRNTRTRYEIYSKLTIKTPKRVIVSCDD